MTLRTFLTGHGEVDKLRVMMPLAIRPEMDPILNQVRRLMARWQKYELIVLDDNLQVWKRTVIHQTFMLLHEFGHIALGHMTRQQRSRSFTRALQEGSRRSGSCGRNAVKETHSLEANFFSSPH
jgi:hypothetical protein